MKEERMKSFRTAILTVVLAFGFSGSAGAQSNSATNSCNATATIVTGISLTKTADLNFGSVVPGGAAGAVVMSPAGARSATGGASLGSSTGSSAGSFTVAGLASAAYSITLPASTTIASGGNNMTVDTFASTPSGTGTLSGGGTQTLSIGATLHVAASQPTGTYSGSFNVTVTYN
jgi:hypothetical protein